MARHLRLEYEGAIYHVTCRGIERSRIFKDDRDRERFLEKLAQSVGQYHIRLYAYVLMDNHYHLLVETPRANLSVFMQQINTSYTMFYNVRHQRVGHLFSGRYKARVVEGEAYLLRLTRYVHLNPVKTKVWRSRPVAERVAHLRSYPWSSYRAYAGLERRLKWVDYAPLSELVGEGSVQAGLRYAEFVKGGAAEDDAEFQDVLAQSGRAIGGLEFRRSIEVAFRQRRAQVGSDADIALRRVETGADPQRIIARVCAALQVEPEILRRRRNLHPARLLALRLLRDHAALTQRQVAQLLGLKDASCLTRLRAKADNLLAASRSLRRLHRRLDKELAAAGREHAP